MNRTTPRVRGLFVNVRAGLFLTFQLNPTEIDFDKTPNYEEEPIVGYHTSHVYWSSDNPQKISFDLFFDARNNRQNVKLFSLGDVGLGVLGTKAILESFLYPMEVDLLQKVDEDLLQDIKNLFNSNRFLAPPDIYFIYGPRWYKGKLTAAPIKEKAFDKSLIPQQLETNVSITVLEDGAFKKWNSAHRKGMATAKSMGNAVELPFNLSL